MKNEDQLTDALLKEHAKHGAGADEKFLKELEERLDAKEAGDKVIAMPKRSAGSRWALGTGIAACLALGFGGVQFWKGYQKSQVVRVTPEVTSYTDPFGLLAEGEVESVSEPTRTQPQTEAKVIAALSARESHVSSPSFEVTSDDLHFEIGDELALEFDQRNRGEVKGAAFGDGAQSNGMVAGQIGSLGKVENVEISNIAAPSVATAPSELKIQGAVYAKKAQIIGGNVAGCVIPIPEPPARQNTERYGQLVENTFKAPVDERSALSTFAVDVDTASYANLRRMINHGQHIPADSVRIEEMVNYFDYDYAQPTDKHPFAVHVDSAACLWNEKHRLVRVGIQGKEIIREERPATNLVFLLDVSGSMNSSNKLPLLKKSMKYLLEELNDQDTVSIVVYAGASGLALPATKVDDAGRQKIEQTMDRLSAGGSTAGGQGIKLAYKVAKENFKKDGVNRIILATDGDFNVGVSDNASLTKLVKEKAKQGTYLSVLGFGHGNINDAMLESITNNGNGNYSYIDSVKEGRKVLLEDMMGTMVTIAKDVKVQVVMNPNKVKAYRLIGYANRMLPPEAFLDKKVDAGEIGAGHTVTALYEVIPADGTPFGDKIDATRYFKKPETKPNPALKDSPEMMFVKLAYKQPDQKMEDESTYVSKPFVEDADTKVSNDHKFASAVGLFGMVVRNSEHKGNGNLEMVLKLAKESKGPDGKGQRAEFIQLVERFAARESR